MASTVGGVQDLVVEYREIEGETKTDRVGWGEFSLCNIGGVLGFTVSGKEISRVKLCCDVRTL